ncbi:hypothetical protein [Streptomyces sp. NPDC001652]|uniref:hypothetical protein n=1 Tax=Streptomyces sp. NPDC001652 TaxID=3154393 RepID=UPI0033333C58
MLDIRIICDPDDGDRVNKALSQVFTTGPVRDYPTRDGERLRLYVSAEHRPDTGPWPTPEAAYALAPSMVSEVGWTADQAARKPFGTHLPRDFWLRKAALLDRIALHGETDGFHDDAAEAAIEAAHRLIAFDRDGEGDCHGTPYGPENAVSNADPRGYVRQEYAHWAKTH